MNVSARSSLLTLTGRTFSPGLLFDYHPRRLQQRESVIKAVAAMSSGLLTFHRNRTARDAAAIANVSELPIAIRPSKTQAPRRVPLRPHRRL